MSEFPIKLIVAGCRDYFNFDYISQTLDRLSLDPKKVEFVNGGANGVDAMARKYAGLKGFNIRLFPADWNNLGKRAGPIRNKQMAEYGTHLIAFWDGISKGTENMISLAKERDLTVLIIPIIHMEK